MNDIVPLLELDYATLLVTVITFMIGMTALKKIIEEFCKWTGIELKWMREKREQKELVENTANEVQEVKKEHSEIMQALDKILLKQDERQERNDFISAMTIRRQLVTGCEEAISRGSISFTGLSSLEDLYKVYHSEEYLNQNSYVTDLMEKVRRLEVSRND